MRKQVIVTIGREYGSAGHFIAEKLAEKLGVELYDKKFIEGACEEIGYSREVMQKYDEQPSKIFISRKIGSYTNSIEEIVQEKVADFIRARAESGESFVEVGRCSDQILRDNPNAVRVFVMGDREEKIHRIMELYSLTREKAAERIDAEDKRRRRYHNAYSDYKWGDSRGYHLCVNSSLVGIDATVEILEFYVKKFVGE